MLLVKITRREYRITDQQIWLLLSALSWGPGLYVLCIMYTYIIKAGEEEGRQKKYKSLNSDAVENEADDGLLRKWSRRCFSPR